MWVIRRKQIEAMRWGRLLLFVDWTVGYVGRSEPGLLAKLGEDRLRRRVRWATKMADERGLKDENALLAYVLLVLDYGPTFHELGAVEDILADRSLPMLERIDALRLWAGLHAQPGTDDRWRELDSRA